MNKSRLLQEVGVTTHSSHPKARTNYNVKAMSISILMTLSYTYIDTFEREGKRGRKREERMS